MPKSRQAVERQIDRYLSTFNAVEIKVSRENNPEITWDELYELGTSIDDCCSLSGRILS